jgi:hypothetical protein
MALLAGQRVDESCSAIRLGHRLEHGNECTSSIGVKCYGEPVAGMGGVS